MRMPGSLVICVGNVARGDDGVAHRVAALLDGRLPAETRLVTATQLDIAMADEVCEAAVAVFVDAERRGSPPVEVRPVEAEPHGEFGHALSPGHFLDIAYSLYGARPLAWLVSVAGPEMAHGEGLSPTAATAAEAAVAEVLKLLDAGG